jgi:hypothetical protein
VLIGQERHIRHAMIQASAIAATGTSYHPGWIIDPCLHRTVSELAPNCYDGETQHFVQDSNTLQSAVPCRFFSVMCESTSSAPCRTTSSNSRRSLQAQAVPVNWRSVEIVVEGNVGNLETLDNVIALGVVATQVNWRREDTDVPLCRRPI